MESLAQLNTSLAGRYEVEREIGRGGMATVFLARDLRHDRLVALKVLNPELGAVLGVERFLSEIKVTANLHHPHLLPLFDSGEANGLLFYVMPYVDGESLRARLDREKQLPTETAVAITLAVASALEYAHAHGVIHRDLKPENILLQGGQAVVADFGIALAVSNAGGARVTQTGLSLGTPQYMSPEQATGDRVIDRRSDIYSLAAVTYEMLTGEPPHTGNTMQAIISRVLTERPRSVRLMRPNVPEYIEEALDRALEKVPADRWTSAQEFSDALQGKVAARTGVAARSGMRRRDPLRAVLGAVALALAVIAAWQWRVARHGALGESVRFTLALPRAVRSWTASTQQVKVALSPDGRLLAFIGTNESGIPRIYVRPLNDLGVRPVAGTDGALTVFFSPDSKWLGFWAAGSLMKVPIEGGTPVLVLALPGTFLGATWSVNHEIVFANNTHLFSVPDVGGSPRSLTHYDSAHVPTVESQPLALPDGEHVIFGYWPTTSAGLARLAVASLKGGEPKVTNLSGISALAYIDGRLIYVSAGATITVVPFDVSTGLATGTPLSLQVAVSANILTGAAQAAVTPGGNLIYQSGALASTLTSVDVHGAARPLLPDAKAYAYPRFSPDGKKLAVGIVNANRADVWVIDLATSTPTRLTTEGSVNERPEWTPDGRRVLYRTDADGRTSIWWRPADLSDAAAPLLSKPHELYFEAVLTPDGRDIVYQLDTTGADIYYRALKGDTTPKPIANSKLFTEDMARVSPDGKWVAFYTDESGSAQVVVQPFPGPGARTQISTTGASEPVWSHDGKHIYYRDNQRLIDATVTTSPVFAVTNRKVLFADDFEGSTLPHANYDVAPDGKSFIFLRATTEAELQVVVNWGAELRARVEGKTDTP